MSAVGEERRLEENNATAARAVLPLRWLGTDDHKPLHLAWWPQIQLRRLVAMLIEAMIANPSKMVVVWLPFHRVQGDIVDTFLGQGAGFSVEIETRRT